jgi:peptidoglycan-N-acetylmuramic acid deacetylase
MKRIFIITIAIVLLLGISLNASATSEASFSWYIKRRGNLQPILDSAQELILKHEGYYIDKKLTDESKTKKIYLTFDLGYENGNTKRILDTLNKHNVKAAFFILDNIIQKNTNLVTEMIKNGHLVCNHSKNHKNMSKLSETEIIEDLTSLEKLMIEKTGHNIAKYFRFPEGRYSEEALITVKNLGYKSIFWSFAYEDWDNNKQMPPEKAIKKVLSNTHNGAVMLFHPTSKTNADIFDDLINEWKSMGYSFGTLDELTN